MAATNGDAQEIVRSVLASPNLGDMRVEVHAVDISTGTGGAGSATVSYEEGFAGSEVYPLITGDEGGDWFVSSAGASQATAEVENATASSTVTAYLLVVGKDNAA